MLYPYYLHKDVFSKEECNELIKFAQNTEQGPITDIPAAGKKVEIKIVEEYKFNGQLNFFFDLVKYKNRELWEFDLYDRLGFEPVFFNFYSGQKNEYQFHFDGNTDTARSDIKLTAIVNVSRESYEGGELEIYFGNRIEKIDIMDVTGNLIIFPSFLYHRVKPVTKGERVSMSCWFRGPSWK